MFDVIVTDSNRYEQLQQAILEGQLGPATLATIIDLHEIRENITVEQATQLRAQINPTSEPA